jgi:hypothetical protein
MHGVVQSNGTVVESKEWLCITFADGRRYVGRFSGVYENPSLGRMYYLSFARPVDCSEPSDTIFCPLRDGNGSEAALDAAIPIEKPIRRKGALVIMPKVPIGSVIH